MASELEQLREDGYVVIPDVVPDAVLTQIRDQLDPYLQGEYPGRNDFEGTRSERVYAVLDKAPAIAELVGHPRTLGLIDELLEPNYLLSACLAILLHAGETAQPWHHDDAFVTLPMPRPAYSVSTIWAIDDFTAENGATEVLPGSHRWDATPVVGERDDAVVVEMAAGSVVVFLGTTVHRGGANRSDGRRLAVTPQYCAPWARPQETFTLAVRPSMAASYPQRVRELLGYSIHPPFMGHIDGRHPGKRLDPEFSDADAGRRSGEFWTERVGD